MIKDNKDIVSLIKQNQEIILELMDDTTYSYTLLLQNKSLLEKIENV